MSLKSSLAYKYRPTVKYEVGLRRAGGETLGELSVVFRTRSARLIGDMTAFFRLWAGIESTHLAPRLGTAIPCSLYDGRFLRPIARPNRSCTAEEIAGAISDYVQLFDRLLKGFLCGRLSARDVELAYCDDLEGRTLLI
jgi:hypothetical protein